MLAMPCKAEKQALIYLNERQLRAIVLSANVALKGTYCTVHPLCQIKLSEKSLDTDNNEGDG